MRAPAFWARERGAAAVALAPLSWAHDAAGRLRRGLIRPVRADVPVLCVGNFTAGGAGKTPTVLALARLLAEDGVEAHLLTRGYGGRERGPLRVDPACHDARAVGDEALLLAAAAPTWLARYRPAGAAAAAAAGARLVVMDDGLQTPSLTQDISLAVVDGGAGFGNGCLMPAGPLREPLDRGVRRADAIVLIGPDRHGAVAALGPLEAPVIEAALVPGLEACAFRDHAVVGFAGIGRPGKFFETLADIGCDVVACYAFADHHRYRPDEIMDIVEHASARDAVPVTTEKDYVRLPEEAKLMVRTLSVALEWRDPAEPRALLRPLVARSRRA